MIDNLIEAGGQFLDGIKALRSQSEPNLRIKRGEPTPVTEGRSTLIPSDAQIPGQET
jgi:hypothetical protein